MWCWQVPRHDTDSTVGICTNPNVPKRVETYWLFLKWSFSLIPSFFSATWGSKLEMEGWRIPHRFHIWPCHLERDLNVVFETCHISVGSKFCSLQVLARYEPLWALGSQSTSMAACAQGRTRWYMEVTILDRDLESYIRQNLVIAVIFPEVEPKTCRPCKPRSYT